MNRQILARLITATGLLWSGATWAASSTTIGSTDAYRCFEESRRALSEQGISYCDKAIKNDGLTRRDLAATYSNRGIIYGSNGKFERALSDHNKAIDTVPSLGEAYINRGNVYYHTHDYEMALADYAVAAELGAKPLHIPHYNRALVLLKLKRVPEARAALEEALVLDPDSAKIRNQLLALEEF